MAISTLDQLIAGTKQVVSWSRLTARTTVANGWFTLFDVAGNPGAGTLSAGNSANGVVPTDATAGFPKIEFSSGLGYIGSVAFGGSANGRWALYDRVFHAGTYAYNSGTSNLSSQPSYSARMPGGSYVGTQIWIEVETAFATGTTWSVTVTYTDQDGNAGASTGALGSTTAANLTKGRMYQLALASGDSGVQKIESVVVTTGGMTAGAFNVVVIRPLWTGRVVFNNDGDTHGFDRTGLPQIFGDSALTFMVSMDSTSSGLIDNLITVVSG